MLEILRRILLVPIDTWIPPHARQQQNTRYTHRFLVSILLGTFLYMLCVLLLNTFVLQLSTFENTLMSALTLGVSSGVAASLLTLRLLGSRQLSLNIFIATITATLTYVSLHTGGIFSPVNVCSVIIPALATLSLGPLGGIIWTTIIAFIGSGLLWIDIHDYPIPTIQPGERFNIVVFGSLFTANAFVSFIALYYDISQRRLRGQVLEEQQRYFYQAHHDSLTQLANRRYFIDAINSAIKHAAPAGGQFCVLYSDLNRFKQANDQYGHHFGDEVLARFAQRLAAITRQRDIVARLGGDEFAVLLPGLADEAVIEAKIEEFERTLSAEIILEGIRYSPSASFGYAIYPQHGSDYETLLKKADNNMYRAKRLNRNNDSPETG